MDRINVVILAGDRKASILVDKENKAFLKIRGIPCIVYVVRAFLGSEYAGNIVVVGPEARMKSVLAEYDLYPDSRVKIVAQKENLIENGKAGYVASLEGVPDDMEFQSLDKEKYGEIPVIVSSCDIPLITTREIDEFILRADPEQYDYYIGICEEEVLSYYYPDGENPGIRLTYFSLKEGNYRVNNLDMIKPLKLGRLRYIERMYEIRYQKQWLNMMKLFLEILFTGRGLAKTFRCALKLHLARICFDRGCEGLYKTLKNSVGIDNAFDSISRVLGSRVSYAVTHYGGAALDIDHPEDTVIIEKMYDRWMEYQNGIQPRGRNTRPDMDKNRKEE
jgi:GTP:adenosylcobinamide-phosphate guanylyltransferase